LIFKTNRRRFFFHSCKFCGYLIPGVLDEQLSMETSWTWDIPSHARDRFFRP
jgi:hypothetical protein